jgi:hypothetical protein
MCSLSIVLALFVEPVERAQRIPCVRRTRRLAPSAKRRVAQNRRVEESVVVPNEPKSHNDGDSTIHARAPPASQSHQDSRPDQPCVFGGARAPDQQPNGGDQIECVENGRGNTPDHEPQASRVQLEPSGNVTNVLDRQEPGAVVQASGEANGPLAQATNLDAVERRDCVLDAAVEAEGSRSESDEPPTQPTIPDAGEPHDILPAADGASSVSWTATTKRLSSHSETATENFGLNQKTPKTSTPHAPSQAVRPAEQRQPRGGVILVPAARMTRSKYQAHVDARDKARAKARAEAQAVQERDAQLALRLHKENEQASARWRAIAVK